MNIQQIKKRLEIINEKIERIEELEKMLEIANDEDNPYYKLFGSMKERQHDTHAYKLEIDQLENAIDLEIEILNELK